MFLRPWDVQLVVDGVHDSLPAAQVTGFTET
jgi:hypothetical protein